MLSINPNRQVTRGYGRGTIIGKDNSLRVVPISLIDYLQHKAERKNLTFEEYDTFIDSENLLVENLSNVKEEWSNYSLISNLSVELHNELDFNKVIDISNELLSKTLLIYINYEISDSDFIGLLNKIKLNPFVRTSIKMSKLTLSQSVLERINEIKNLFEVYTEQVYLENKASSFLSEKILIRKKEFSSNQKIELFPQPDLISEAKKYNPYFNSKMHIASTGNILRFKGDDDSFGEIEFFNKKILSLDNFKLFWTSKKDATDICCNCEFRYICVDFRKPVKRKDGSWYHISECEYNPYINKWKGEEGYQNLEKCGVTSNQEGFSVDHKKIAKLNQELWGE